MHLEKTVWGKLHRSVQGRESDLLVILVHGMRTTGSATWNNYPKLLQKAIHEKALRDAGLEALDLNRPRFDVAIFEYDSKLHHRFSLSRTASRLLRLTEQQFSSYPHIVFVAHSLGGLVVKRSITKSALSVRETINGLSKTAGANRMPNERIKTALLPRTRKCIWIGVPHHGGTKRTFQLGMSALRAIKPFLQAKVAILKTTNAFWRITNNVLGRNRDLIERDYAISSAPRLLKPDNPTLRRLEHGLRLSRNFAETTEIPFPAIHDSIGDDEQLIIKQVGRAQPLSGRQAKLDGGHMSVLRARDSSDPAIQWISHHLFSELRRLSILNSAWNLWSSISCQVEDPANDPR